MLRNYVAETHRLLVALDTLRFKVTFADQLVGVLLKHTDSIVERCEFFGERVKPLLLGFDLNEETKYISSLRAMLPSKNLTDIMLETTYTNLIRPLG